MLQSVLMHCRHRELTAVLKWSVNAANWLKQPMEIPENIRNLIKKRLRNRSAFFETQCSFICSGVLSRLALVRCGSPISYSLRSCALIANVYFSFDLGLNTSARKEVGSTSILVTARYSSIQC